MWDSQDGVPIKGDYPLQLNTSYAIELNTKVYISEWGKDIRVMLEEAGFYGEDGFRYAPPALNENGFQEILDNLQDRAGAAASKSLDTN